MEGVYFPSSYLFGGIFTNNSSINLTFKIEKKSIFLIMSTRRGANFQHANAKYFKRKGLF